MSPEKTSPKRESSDGRTRVVMVDDSALARAVLKQILEQEGDIVIVGEADDGTKAVETVLKHKPDLVTMDIDMPGMGGLDAISRLMETCPVPVLVVTGERLGPGTDLGFRAIERGALDFMAKPTVLDPVAAAAPRSSVKILSKVPVFLHASDRPPHNALVTAKEAPDAPPGMPTQVASIANIEIIAIAGGAGGPRALAAILSRFSAEFRCPIAVAQRLPPSFAPAYARYLRSLCHHDVVIVSTPHDAAPGEILLVEGDAHLVCPRRGTFAASREPAHAIDKPSADVFFASIAEAYGSSAVGVILSGSGDDGSEGLLKLRARGALTIAESPRTAMPADMPRAAMKVGAVERAVSAELIADFLAARLSKDAAKSTAPPSGTM